MSEVTRDTSFNSITAPACLVHLDRCELAGGLDLEGGRVMLV